MFEIVWKVYIDFEVGEGECECVCNLYECLFECIFYVKVWILYVFMEIVMFGGGEDEDGNEIEGEVGDVDLVR